MTREFNWQFDVRGYELDAARRVHTKVIHNYLEETAIQASSDAGFGMQWYFERDHAWVMRHMTAKYMAPLTLGDRVAARTWVSDFKRIYSHREYDLRRARDGQPVVRARAKWVYIDLRSMRLMRIPAEFEPAFDPSNEKETVRVALSGAEPIQDSPVFRTDLMVQRVELDAMGHVNNSVYVGWFEQAMFNALASSGWPPDMLMGRGIMLVVTGNDIDYRLPALAGAALRIESQLTERTDTEYGWQHAVVDVASGEPLANCYTVCQFVQLADNQPCSPPESMIKSLVIG